MPDELHKVVIKMGGFHIALNYLSLLGKMYSDTGLEDLLIESGVYVSGTTSALMTGKQYNPGVRAHKLTLEGMFRLKWREFVEWMSEQENSGIDTAALQGASESIRKSFKTPSADYSGRIHDLHVSLKQVQTKLDVFRAKGREEFKTFAYWDNYMNKVELLLSFIKAL